MLSSSYCFTAFVLCNEWLILWPLLIFIMLSFLNIKSTAMTSFLYKFIPFFLQWEMIYMYRGIKRNLKLYALTILTPYRCNVVSGKWTLTIVSKTNIPNLLHGVNEFVQANIRAFLVIYKNKIFECVTVTYTERKKKRILDFQNVGFIMSTNFILLTAIYIHLFRQ